MKFEICSSCGEIIPKEKTSCKTCGSNYCPTCKKVMGRACLCCGDRESIN